MCQWTLCRRSWISAWVIEVTLAGRHDTTRTNYSTNTVFRLYVYVFCCCDIGDKFASKFLHVQLWTAKLISSKDGDGHFTDKYDCYGPYVNTISQIKSLLSAWKHVLVVGYVQTHVFVGLSMSQSQHVVCCSPTRPHRVGVAVRRLHMFVRRVWANGLSRYST